jgi:hypothetical protein
MKPQIHSRCWETTISTGTGPYSLLGAVSGYEALHSQYAVNDPIPIFIADQNNGPNWVSCIAHLTDTSTLVIDSYRETSNNGSPVSFGAGTKDVYVDELADDINSSTHIIETTYIAQTSVTVTHNLGHLPQVQIVESDGSLVDATVVHEMTSKNSFTVSFSYSSTGTIITIG